MTFKPTVLEATPNRELRWLGRLFAPGLFNGEHTLRVEPRNGDSRFFQSEKAKGVLVPLLGSALAKVEEGFHQMNAALKARAERR